MTKSWHKQGILALFMAILVCNPLASTATRAEPVLVFAAASMKDALDAAANAYKTNRQIKVSYAGSSILARQIAAGAPADIFISANIAWMDYLAEKKRIILGSRAPLVGNSLVLITRKGTDTEIKIAEGLDLTPWLADGRMAMGDPDHVPAGIYAKTALQSLNMWPFIVDHLVRTENVRVTLALVARGETPLGIVYGSDAVAEKDLRVLDVFPPQSHQPILYPAALLKNAIPDARAFLTYLQTPAAQAIFRQYGFRPATLPVNLNEGP